MRILKSIKVKEEDWSCRSCVIDSYVNDTNRDDANNSVVDDINGDEAPGASNVGKSKRTESKGVINNQSKINTNNDLVSSVKSKKDVKSNKTDVNNTVNVNIIDNVNVNVSSVDAKHNCYICSETVWSDGFYAVGCDGCLTWIHQHCLNLDDYEFGLVQKSDNFYCNVCLDKAPCVLNIRSLMFYLTL